MKTIKIKTPAKINLSLELLEKLNNGYHNISSVMQTVDLYDYLTINIQQSDFNRIILSGNSLDIPYDNQNIVYKACERFLEKINLSGFEININIEKNIPVEAGLAGGSTNAAGTLLGLNKLFNKPLNNREMHEIASFLGSDLNFCLVGGACRLSSRGEIIDEKLPFREIDFVIIKPKNISISTKQCYQNYDILHSISKHSVYSLKISDIYKNNFSLKNLSANLYNDLELAVDDLYPELKQIKTELIENGALGTIMTGSGSAVFGVFDEPKNIVLNNNYKVYQVKSIPNGVEIV